MQHVPCQDSVLPFQKRLLQTCPGFRLLIQAIPLLAAGYVTPQDEILQLLAPPCSFGSLSPPFLPCNEYGAGGRRLREWNCVWIWHFLLAQAAIPPHSHSTWLMPSPSFITLILRDAVPVSIVQQCPPAASLSAKEPAAYFHTPSHR